MLLAYSESGEAFRERFVPHGSRRGLVRNGVVAVVAADLVVAGALADFEYRQEGFLGNLHAAHALHAALTLFLLVE